MRVFLEAHLDACVDVGTFFCYLVGLNLHLLLIAVTVFIEAWHIGLGTPVVSVADPYHETHVAGKGTVISPFTLRSTASSPAVSHDSQVSSTSASKVSSDLKNGV